MVSPALLAPTLALLVAAAGADHQHERILLMKCCDTYEMLSADGRSCVEAAWPRNVSVPLNESTDFDLDGAWVQRWLPPGLPLRTIKNVIVHDFASAFVSSVNASSLWNSSFIEHDLLSRNTITFFGHYNIARPRPDGGFTEAFYCVDAALPPLGPYAIKFRNLCSENECARKCCKFGELMKEHNGLWNCQLDAEGYWEPKNSSLALDPEFPITAKMPQNESLQLSTWEVKSAQQALQNYGTIQYRFSTWDTCFDFYRRSDGSLHEGLFYKKYPNITKGFYWLLRPLCVLSALLLLASLVSIACNKSIRRKIHGWCLASHTACLFIFNVGHILYYLTISDHLDREGKLIVSRVLGIVCKYIALSMYLLLISAWFWLTALCVNMAKGFSLQVGRPRKESRKRFLALSTFAWGLPVLMTIACFFLFAHDKQWQDVRWYNPSLAETRVCYNEFIAYKIDNLIMRTYFLKSGTALFYFGPVACVVMGNVICLAVALRKVQYLKRGNSVLRREEDKAPLGQRQPEGNILRSAQTAQGHANRNRSGSTVDAKTIKLYIKMILMTGGFELLTEIIMWFLTVYDEHDDGFDPRDDSLGYRTAGYVTDFFRAAVVTWLTAPEGGYLGLVRRLRRGKGEKKKNIA